MGTWLNADGLFQRFGNDQAAVALGGAVSNGDAEKELVITINGADVPATDAPIQRDLFHIPQGATITGAYLYVTTAFAGVNATLDVGLMEDDGDGTFSTEDDDGIFSAIATTTLTDGAQVALDGAYGSTQVATETHSRPYVVSYGYNTAAFTAGVAKLVIRYIKN